MSINLSVPQDEDIELKPRITVVGVGGAGGNAVNNMINAELEGVEFLVANTDAQALTFSKTDRRIQLGSGLTQGLGAGSKPEIGRAAAEESIEQINEYIKGSHMVFIAAGMGGGTGSGAAPVIARAARDLGILTVGVVTKPFQFEGRRRQSIADSGIEELEQYVDTLIVIPNQNLFRVANEKTTFADAFKMADDVLYSGVRGITDLMVMPGLINLDFADVRSVMSEMGKAMMGTGEAEGERRALDAAEAAIANPLLDDTSMAGANGVLINITGGADMTLYEVDEAANRIRSEVDEDAYIIFGSTYDETMSGSLRVSVVATGIDAESIVRPAPAVLSVHTEAVAHQTVEPDHPQNTLSEFEQATPQSFVDAPVEVVQEQVEALVEDTIKDEPEFEIESSTAYEEAIFEDDSEAKEFCAPEPVPAPESMIVPPSMPSALNEDAFMPPPPLAESHNEHIDPMAEAALLNGSAVEPEQQPVVKEKGPSLFARVTGGAKKKVSAFGVKSEPVSTPKSSAFSPQTPNDMSSQRTTSVLRSQGSAELEPILGGLEPEQRMQTSPAEDDLLDIPAFLRRQAN